ncbi:radical SAM protein [bacterium]|nr:radical SAM protein [bacterium]
MVGFYTNSDNIHEVLRLANYAKTISPSVKIILGGPLASVEFRQLILNDDIDFVASGDGEYLTLELLQSLDKCNSDFSHINGLTWKNTKNKTVVNKPRATFRDLDSLPIPDRSIYPIDGISIRSQIVTSRGCGFRCTFCFESTNRKYRSHSVDRVIEEIKLLKNKYNTSYFVFVDDVFTTNHKRLRELCHRFIDEFTPHKDFFWYCEARVDTLSKYPDLVPLMKKAGLVRIQIGTESGSQKVIDAYKKQICLLEIVEAVSQCVKANVLSIFDNFIVGGALETTETLEQTRQLALKLLRLAPGKLEINASFLSPYPGTDITMRPEAYEVKIIDHEFISGLSDDYIFVESLNIPKQQIIDFERNFLQEFRREMIALIPKLSIEELLKHLSMNKYGLQTRWSDLFKQDSILSCTAKVLATKVYYRYSKDKDFSVTESLVPLRTFSLRDWKNESFFWILRRKKLQLNAFEFYILECCGGKLSIREIIDLSVKFWNGKVTFIQMKKDVIKFLEQLSEESLMVFRLTPKLKLT